MYNRNVGWSNPAYSRGLPQRPRTGGCEFQPRFGAKPRDLTIVNAARNDLLVVPFQMAVLVRLSGCITLVLKIGFQQLPYWNRHQPSNLLWQVRVIKIRPLKQMRYWNPVEPCLICY